MSVLRRAPGAPVTGLLLWTVPSGAALLLGAGPTLVRWLLLLAVVVLVPVGAPLLGAPTRGVAALRLAGVPVVLAVLLPVGPLAVVLVAPWLAVAVVLAVVAAWRWRAAPSVAGIPVVAAAGFLVVGAAWLLADRAGLAPLGFGPPYTALTAVHFHHAGAVATTVVAAGWWRAPTRVRGVATALVVAAPPVVGLGFLGLRWLQVVGAVLLAAGLWAWAVAELRDGTAGVLRRAAALAVVAPMALAVQWALGDVVGTPALSVPAMAATHGVCNALGFGLLGVLGQRGAAGPGDPAPTLASAASATTAPRSPDGAVRPHPPALGEGARPVRRPG